MDNKKPWIVFAVVVVVLLGLTIPLQFLVKREVVVGMGQESAHSHAHDDDEHEHEHADEEEGEDGHEHEHPEEEDHLGAEVSLGTNLIANYSFEVGTRGQMWGWAKTGEGQGAILYRDDEVSRAGEASAAVNTRGISVIDAGWVMKLDELPRAHDVIFEGYIKTEDLAGEAYLKVIAEGGEEGDAEPQLLLMASTDDVHGDTDWEFSELRCYIPPEATAVWLEVGVYGVGKAWFDDLSLVVEEREDLLTSGVDLLQNSSFDQWLDGWHLFSETETPALGYSVYPAAPDGGNALVMSDETPGTMERKESGFYQAICGLYGHEGTLRIRGRVNGYDLDGEAFIDVVVFGASGNSDIVVSPVLTGNTQWFDFENEVPIDAETASVWVRINLDSGGILSVDFLQAVYEK